MPGIKTHGQIREALNGKKPIELILPQELYKKIHNIAFVPPISIDEQQVFSTDTFLSHFENICAAIKNNKKLKDKQKLALEEYKLIMMEVIYARINQAKEKAEEGTIKSNEIEKQSILKEIRSGLNKILGGTYTFLFLITSLVGLAQSSVEIFFGSQMMLSAIFPAIGVAALISVALFVTITYVPQFFAFEATMMSDMLGVSLFSNAKHLLNVYRKQQLVTKRINNSLLSSDRKKMTLGEYNAFMPIALRFNEDITCKKEMFNQIVQGQKKTSHRAKKSLKKILQWGLLGCGLVTAAIFSYFGAVALLTTVAGALLGTPVGWAIIGVLVITSVALYCAMEARALKEMLEPTAKLFDAVKEKFTKFKVKNKDDFQLASEEKPLFATVIPANCVTAEHVEELDKPQQPFPSEKTVDELDDPAEDRPLGFSHK